MRISKSVFAGFLTAALMTYGGNVYAHSTNQNSGYDKGEMMNRGSSASNMPGVNGMMYGNGSNMPSTVGKRENEPFDKALNCGNHSGFRMNRMMEFHGNSYGMGYENRTGYRMGGMMEFMQGGFLGGQVLISRLRKLNLSETQIAFMRPVTMQMREERILFMGKMAALQSKIMAAKISYPIDFDKISSYIDERLKLVNDFQKEQLNNLKKIYNSLTPGQKKTLAYY